MSWEEAELPIQTQRNFKLWIGDLNFEPARGR